MSIKPIDLQTLFSHINQVGKEQAAQKNAMLMQQAATANEIVEETHQKDESVNEAKPSSDGPEQVNDEGKGFSGGKNESKRKKENKKEEKKYFEDPQLGKHIDLEG